jgi:nitric oxide reductase subunit B
MEVGSIWGHGSYVAPDWTADYLHREAMHVLDSFAQQEFRKGYDQLEPEHQAQMRGRLEVSFRKNTFDSATGTLTIEPAAGGSIRGQSGPLHGHICQWKQELCDPKGAVTDSGRLRALTRSSFGRRGLRSANRPGDDISYTQNWPHEPLVGNRPTANRSSGPGEHHHALGRHLRDGLVVRGAAKLEADTKPPEPTRWEAGSPRRRRRATLKYFWVVAALILVPDYARMSSPPTMAWKGTGSTAFRFPSGCPIVSLAPGTSSSVCFGSPPPGWRPGYSLGRW